MPCVLSTKILDEKHQNLILNSGWGLVVYNAIETQKLPKLSHLAHSPFANGIVTSQKTVSILKKLQVDIKQVFCVGQKTAQQLKQAGYTLIEIANYGEDLAAIIEKKYPHLHFDFFCGEKRNPALPYSLNRNKIQFTEHHLYTTASKPQAFSRSFDAVLFFSPSGVESHYSVNSYQGERIVCIGNTTASAAKKITQQVEVASQPTIESVVVRLIKGG